MIIQTGVNNDYLIDNTGKILSRWENYYRIYLCTYYEFTNEK